MTPTRRDMLKLAAAITAVTPLAPFATSPAQAAALLDESVEFDAGQGREPIWATNELDPVSFAEAVDGVDWSEFFGNCAPLELAAYKQTYHAMIDALGVDVRDLPVDHPLLKLDERVLDLWSMSWMAGIRAGAAAEHLRLALQTPRALCGRCDGQGQLWGDHWLRDEAKPRWPCPDCAGAGTVATRPATLDIAG